MSAHRVRDLAKHVTSRLPTRDLPIMVRLARGGLWSLAGEAGSRASSFISAIIVARWLGVAEYGAFALIQSTLALLLTFAVFGMGHTTSRYIAALRNTDVTRVQGINSLVLLFAALTGIVTTAALFVAAPYFATTILAAPELAGPLRTVAPVLLLYAITGAAGGTILGFEAFKQSTRIAWICGVSSIVAIVVGISFLGFQGAIAGLVAGELIRCALTVLLARQIMRQNGLQLLGRAHLREVKILWQFSLPLLLTSVLFTSITWFCQAAIARQTDGLTEIGLYDVAQKCMTLVALVPVAASAAFGPVLANLSGDGDTSVQKRVTVNLAIVQLFLTAVAAATVALAAPCVPLVFGPGFVTASPVVLVTMALAPVYVLRHLYWQATISAGHAWTSVMLSAVWAAVASGLTWIWQTGGATALAKAMLVAHGVTLLANVLMLEWFSRRGSRWKFACWGRKELGA
jgi:O-antigen/teichoic acid export membrane protein